MKILIVGGGGREHALAWKAKQTPKVQKVFVAPGNAGTALEHGVSNIHIPADDITGLLEFAKTENIDLTIVGPEAPLVNGIVNQFTSAGLACFGPTAQAAQLEGSKSYCKDFMIRHGIPTAKYQSFTDKVKAIEYIRNQGAPIVVKADGLASGKGVVVAQTEEEAIAAVENMLSGQFGTAGQRLVIEEYLTGEEASFIVIADGERALPMATSQDHKARDDGDSGPNTGGMGAYSPAPVVTPEIHQRIMTEVIQPTLKGMREDGNEYTGFLYAGLMIGRDHSIRVLEYNCRFGDPETQPIMMRLKSDLIELCQAGLNKNLDQVHCEWDNRPALGVVLAAGGYPDAPRTGDILKGLPEQKNDDCKVFHAGTQQINGNLVTTGGRILCVSALGNTIAEAQQKAYRICRQIDCQGIFYRTDIGSKAISR